MKALKTFVIGMGVLILAGIGLVGYGLSRKSPAAHPPAGTTTPYAVDLSVAPGSRLEQMETLGDQLVLRVSNADKDQVLVVDPRTGQVTGRLSFTPDGR